MAKIISLWSGPRNISTAMMYSFSRREDMKVVDEPLYGHYLKVTGVSHPGRDEILESMETNPEVVWNECKEAAENSTVFLKNMGHHALDLNDEWYDEPVPVFLIRDPRDMLPSLAKVLEKPGIRDTGLPGQMEILRKVKKAGKEPVVIEGADILRNPAGMLDRLCDAIGIPFNDNMLEWPAGPIPEDGIWARYWYDQVHNSTGFNPWKPGHSHVPADLQELLEECQPYYNELKTYKLSY